MADGVRLYSTEMNKSNLDQSIVKFQQHRVAIGVAELNPVGVGFPRDRGRLHFAGMKTSVSEKMGMDSETLHNAMSERFPEIVDRLKSDVDLHVSLEDILLPDEHHLLSAAEQELKVHPMNGPTVVPLKKSKSAKRQRVDEDLDESGDKDNGEAEGDEQLDVEGEGTEPKYEDWVYDHTNSYAKLEPPWIWTMPALNPLYQRYKNNMFFVSLSPRFQCCILYRDAECPLEGGIDDGPEESFDVSVVD